MLEQIRSLNAYSAWANGQILDTAAKLTPQQFTASQGGAPSIRDILVHTLAGQRTWQERWRGAPVSPWWDTAEFPEVASLRAAWAEVNADGRAYLATLSEADLLAPLTYVNFSGETWSYIHWQTVLDEINHATQHRSEVAWLLTAAGHSPGDLDYLIYLDNLPAAN